MPEGSFSIAGPKEVGHAIADAFSGPTSEGGKQIRGLSGPPTANVTAPAAHA